VEGKEGGKLGGDMKDQAGKQVDGETEMELRSHHICLSAGKKWNGIEMHVMEWEGCHLVDGRPASEH
jgi:hypothetical protein